MQNKVVIPGKVDRLNSKSFRVNKEKASEIEATIEILDDPSVKNGSYQVDKLSVEGLPEKMEDGTPIRWFTNFAIRRNGEYLRQRYTVTIPGLSSANVVILDGQGNLSYYKGSVTKDTIELTDGDPGLGSAP